MFPFPPTPEERSATEVRSARALLKAFHEPLLRWFSEVSSALEGVIASIQTVILFSRALPYNAKLLVLLERPSVLFQLSRKH